MSKSDLARPAGDNIWTPPRIVASIALVALGALIFVSVNVSRTSVATDAPLAAMNEAYRTADGPQPEPPNGARMSAKATVPANPAAPAVAAK